MRNDKHEGPKRTATGPISWPPGSCPSCPSSHALSRPPPGQAWNKSMPTGLGAAHHIPQMISAAAREISLPSWPVARTPTAWHGINWVYRVSPGFGGGEGVTCAYTPCHVRGLTTAAAKLGMGRIHPPVELSWIDKQAWTRSPLLGVLRPRQTAARHPSPAQPLRAGEKKSHPPSSITLEPTPHSHTHNPPSVPSRRTHAPHPPYLEKRTKGAMG